MSLETRKYKIVLSIMLEGEKKLLVIRNASFFMTRNTTHLKYNYVKSMTIKQIIETNTFMVNVISDTEIKRCKRLYLSKIAL